MQQVGIKYNVFKMQTQHLPEKPQTWHNHRATLVARVVCLKSRVTVRFSDSERETYHYRCCSGSKWLHVPVFREASDRARLGARSPSAGFHQVG